MANNNDRTRKLLVRSALVTSATIATFVGAQNLAMLDATRLQQLLTPSPQAVAENPVAVEATAAQIQQAAPNLVIQQAAPSIIILRHGGQQPQPVVNTAPQAAAPAAIQPPAPSQISAPAPIVVQQPVTQSSNSSR
ncbi:MAG TPA: hypothetical protein PLQ56_13575 [Aggregatilineales bacterium]|nr:hypothetical protein [Aggregatilineales bacterium]